MKKLDLIKTRGKPRTDSPHVLGAIRNLNRLECMGATIRKVLNDLASEAPDWLLETTSATTFDVTGIIPENLVKKELLPEQHFVDISYGNAHNLVTSSQDYEIKLITPPLLNPSSQAAGGFGLRRCRYIGLAKTLLENIAIACAINLTRVIAWFEGIPQEST